ncbi:MAG: TRAP transporter substrate-binding protein [Alphaproteobacteria bacterium]|nr:TRAP transporter substrate-binding protein [Alphaproteobacteria bacterium]
MRTIAKLAGAVAMTAFAGSAMAQAPIVLKLHHQLGPKSPAQTRMLEPWAKKVEANSKGRVKIEIYPSMALGGSPLQVFRQIRDGVVDLGWTPNGYTPGLFPRSEVFELPFVQVNDPAAASRAAYDMFEKHLKQEYKGVKVLFMHMHAGHAIQLVSKHVHSPADLKGLKIRTPSRTGAWIIEALGASPVSMPVPDLPQAFSKNVIDAALIPWEIIVPFKLQTFARVQVEGRNRTRFGSIIFQVSMNEAKWNSLPADVKKAFEDASGADWWEEAGRIWAGSDDIGFKLVQENKNTYIELNDEQVAAFRTALEPVAQRWVKEVSAKGIPGQQILDEARALVQKYTKK